MHMLDFIAAIINIHTSLIYPLFKLLAKALAVVLEAPIKF